MEGRVVVVTGGSAGVGRAVARRCAARGTDVAVLARDSERLHATAKELEAAGVRSLAVPTDVAEFDQVEAAADRVEAELGPIDVWINNAMTSVFAPFVEVEPEEFERVTNVTYLGVVHGTMSALRRMRPRDRGVIVQVGSALAYRAIPLQSAYCGAKHAVRGFTDSVRTELIHDGSGIRLVQVHLPALNTPQFDWVRSRLPKRPQPVPPIYQPEVAARAIVWAAEHPRREVWVGIPTAATILANRVAPGLLDRYLGRTGYRSQQAEELADPSAPANLWEPVQADVEARGRFDTRAHDRSLSRPPISRPLVAAFLAAAATIGLRRFTRTR
jgi:NAD(P)-dependent dehydrogenase (short-subunit alcohol dehydrogenase family)